MSKIPVESGCGCACGLVHKRCASSLESCWGLGHGLEIVGRAACIYDERRARAANPCDHDLLGTTNPDGALYPLPGEHAGI